ncbi:hypothetical protein FGK63_14255 [Ruegeria sediminis]|uniref:Uncharacterized protein n=1 Tax=Ruegeria sediminis TaxID=2583820 RepID=A0ABY2WVJ8_9RHOB|nr:hypothetical protein [Ruegeria sediminis]TMV06317.1 hypothetical protein FGK63_14255 [Ruegeria sediminis]
MMPRDAEIFAPLWTLVDALNIFTENHPGEELTMTEIDVRRITGMGIAIRPALRKAGFLNPRPGVWVRPA